MRTALICILALILALPAEAQLYHACPLHQAGYGSYENPLFERWLSAYDIKYYHLNLSVSNKSTFISGSATIFMETVRETDTVVLELQDALEVTRVAVSDATVDPPVFTDLSGIEHGNDALFIPLDGTRTAGEELTLLVEYGGLAGQERGFFAGISNGKDPNYGFDVTYTLSEPHNARDWFPAKQVLEDRIDSVRFTLVCDQDLMAASNGILEEVVPVGGGKHAFQWHTAYPMAYYLLSFAVADYRDLSFQARLSEEGDSVLVQNYIYDTDQLLVDWEEGIRATGPMISLFSELLTDYPFSEEKYGHAMAPLGGGMEHQTMTTIQDFGFYLVAHELAHQWFGDHITCGNWQDIWINEGFASYMEYVAAQHLLGQEAADAWMENAMSIALREISGSVYVPEEEVEDTYRLFDYGLSYKKGAVLLHMIRNLLDDDELFFRVLRVYLEQQGNGLATGEDFRALLETESGMDFSCFFEQWYYGEGYPRFQIQWYQQGDSLIIQSEQEGSTPAVTPLFTNAFEVGIRFAGGPESRIRLIQDKPAERFALAVEGVVTDLIFDPGSWLLKTASVSQRTPPDRTFVYGPNPVTGELFIRFPNTSFIDEIRITTLGGQEVARFTDAGNPVTMNLTNLANGAYMLVMTEDERTYMERIVKLSR